MAGGDWLDPSGDTLLGFLQRINAKFRKKWQVASGGVGWSVLRDNEWQAA
jgi:hypothetical protein